MKLVILAGGRGSRISEETYDKPKPMIKIGKHPIIWHIIKYFLKYKVSEIIIAAGYKSEVIKKYFNNFKIKNTKITIVNTGLYSMTGYRIKKLEKYLKNQENFFLTYGDGLSNVDINKLLKFHLKNKKIATLTAVRPPARFGKMKLNGKYITEFREKNQLDEGRINGGFFVFNKKIFRKIKNNKKIILEHDVLPKLAFSRELCAYIHDDYWQCMDTLRDKNTLNKEWKKKPSWKNW